MIDVTKKQYATSFKFIEKHCQEHYPDSVDENRNLILPMNIKHLKGFLGDMGVERADKTIKAKSTVTGYCSVIKFYYRQNQIKIDDEHVAFFKD